MRGPKGGERVRSVLERRGRVRGPKGGERVRSELEHRGRVRGPKGGERVRSELEHRGRVRRPKGGERFRVGTRVPRKTLGRSECQGVRVRVDIQSKTYQL